MNDDKRKQITAAWENTFDEIVAIPVGIVEFAEEMCGLDLDPNQKLVAKIYVAEDLDENDRLIVAEWIEKGYVPVDFWKRYERAVDRGGFKELLLVIGRRGSKSFLAALLACYEVYKLLLKKNPHKHYKMLDNEPITIALVAATGTQAAEALFPKLKSMISRCEWLLKYIPKDGIKTDFVRFQTLDDMEHDKNLKREQGIETVTSSVKIQIFNAESGATRGRACLVVIFEEFGHYQNREGRDNAYNMYEALAPATTDFGKDGRIVIISSPLYEAGKLFDTHTDVWEGKKQNTIGFQIPSWVMYEGSNNPRFTFDSLQEDDESIEFNTPEWWREYGAQFQKSVSIFLNSEHIERMFTQAEEMGWDWQTGGKQMFYYHAHGDPAKNIAGFPMVVCHYDPQYDKVFVDWGWNWRVKKRVNDPVYDRETVFESGSVIDYELVVNEGKNLLDKFFIRRFTFDQFNSIAALNQLQKHAAKFGYGHVSVNEYTFDGKREYDAYLKFRVELSKGRIICPRWLPLQRELNSVINKNGKIVPSERGATRTKDIVDTLVVSAVRALEDADERGRKDRMSTGDSFTQMGGMPLNMPTGVVVQGAGSDDRQHIYRGHGDSRDLMSGR